MRERTRHCLFRWVSIILIVVMATLNLRLFMKPYAYQETAWDDRSRECTDQIEVEILTRANVTGFEASSSNTFSQFHWNSDLIDVVGVQRNKRGFLTIGIPSIKRLNGVTYLMQTLTSLVDETTPTERNDIVIIVFLADLDVDHNANATRQIVRRYEREIAAGFIQILRVAREYYPPLENLKRNFNDPPERVTWRAKQVADYVLMFKYGRNLSDYYLHLEDDVVCSKRYATSIRRYVESKNGDLGGKNGDPGEKVKHVKDGDPGKKRDPKNNEDPRKKVDPGKNNGDPEKSGRWAMLEFSELGFIGKLFRAGDLDRLATFMMTFYEEQPVDWLMTYFRLSMAQRRVHLRKPTLFQHVGRTSSFDTTKDNALVDRYFDSGDKPWTGDNPPATVLSTMAPFEGHTPDLAYSSGSGFFWAAKVVAGDVLLVVFDDEHRLAKVVVETGCPQHPNDRVGEATLHVGFTDEVAETDPSKTDDVCANATFVSRFADGRTEVGSLDERFERRAARCLKVAITEGQSNWVVFYQIAVFLAR